MLDTKLLEWLHNQNYLPFTSLNPLRTSSFVPSTIFVSIVFLFRRTSKNIRTMTKNIRNTKSFIVSLRNDRDTRYDRAQKEYRSLVRLTRCFPLNNVSFLERLSISQPFNSTNRCLKRTIHVNRASLAYETERSQQRKDERQLKKYFADLIRRSFGFISVFLYIL